MKSNIGKFDRFIRIFLALTTGYLYYTKVISGSFSLMTVCLILFATGIAGNCPLYSFFGISTKARRYQVKQGI